MNSIQNKGNFVIGDTLVLAFDSTIVPGNSIVVAIGGADVDTAVITDDGSNSYTLADWSDDGIGNKVAIWYCLAPAEPGNIQIVSSGASFVTGTIIEYPTVSGIHASNGAQITVSPIELDLDISTGDIVIAHAKGLGNSEILSGEVDGNAADLLDYGLNDFKPFDYLSAATGTFTVHAVCADEGNVFAAIAAASLIQGGAIAEPGTPLFMGSTSLL